MCAPPYAPKRSAASVATMCASVARMCGCVAAMMSSAGVSARVATLGVYFSPHSLALLASLNQLWRLNHGLHPSVNLLHSSMDCLTVVAGSRISCSRKSSVMASSVASVSGTRMTIAIGLVGAREDWATWALLVSDMLLI